MTGPEATLRTAAVVLAGGSGARFGGSFPKQLLEIAGKPVIEHSLATFEAAPEIDEVLVVMVPGFVREVEKIVDAGAYYKVTQVIEGGATRNESTSRAITVLGDRARDVLFHDAARPLVERRTIADCVRMLRTRQVVCTAIPTTDTILAVAGGTIAGIPNRDGLWRCQTPQGFRLAVIRRAYELAMADPAFAEGREGTTDDCGVLLRYLPEITIHVVPGSDRNVKITHPADIHVADALARGFDASFPPPASREHA